MRLPIANTIQSRDGTLDKDAKLVNFYVEGSGVESAVVSRPGTLTVYEGSGPGQGIFHQGGKVWVVSEDILSELSPTATGAPSENTLVGGIVGTGSEVLTSITYGNGVFVAIGNTGKFYRSSDGRVWNTGVTWPVTTPSSATFVAVAFGAGKFVAVTNGSRDIATSTDGVSWSLVSNAIPAAPGPFIAQLSDIAWNGSRFCAVASVPNAYGALSVDGVSWSSTTLPGSTGYLSVTGGRPENDEFVATANSSGTNAAAYFDGALWSAASNLPAPAGGLWTGVTSNSSIFCLSDENGFATSSDGVTWSYSAVSSPNGNGWLRVDGENDVLFAMEDVVSASRGAAYSLDGGQTWTNITLSNTGDERTGWADASFGGANLCFSSSNGFGKTMVVKFKSTYELSASEAL